MDKISSDVVATSTLDSVDMDVDKIVEKANMYADNMKRFMPSLNIVNGGTSQDPEDVDFKIASFSGEDDDDSDVLSIFAIEDELNAYRNIRLSKNASFNDPNTTAELGMYEYDCNDGQSAAPDSSNNYVSLETSKVPPVLEKKHAAVAVQFKNTLVQKLQLEVKSGDVGNAQCDTEKKEYINNRVTNIKKGTWQNNQVNSALQFRSRPNNQAKAFHKEMDGRSVPCESNRRNETFQSRQQGPVPSQFPMKRPLLQISPQRHLSKIVRVSILPTPSATNPSVPRDHLLPTPSDTNHPVPGAPLPLKHPLLPKPRYEPPVAESSDWTRGFNSTPQALQPAIALHPTKAAAESMDFPIADIAPRQQLGNIDKHLANQLPLQ